MVDQVLIQGLSDIMEEEVDHQLLEQILLAEQVEQVDQVQQIVLQDHQ
jgi:hypothetical protein